MPVSNINLLNTQDPDGLVKIESSYRSGLLKQATERSPAIERRRKLSPEAFMTEYRSRQRPVIIEGLLDDWPALAKWSFEYLAETCGSAQVIVDSYNSQLARSVTFAEFVELLTKSRATGQPPIYLQEWYYQTNCPWLAADLPELAIAAYDFRRQLYGEEISTNHQLWIGQKGGITRLHMDSYCIDVMHAQILGSKRWSIIGPQAYLGLDATGEWDFAALVDDPRSQIMHGELGPGEVIYLPAKWRHRVELLGDSAGLGRKCLDEANLREHVRLRFAELAAMALNADEIKQTHPELYDLLVHRNRAWAKRMKIDLSKLRP